MNEKTDKDQEYAQIDEIVSINEELNRITKNNIRINKDNLNIIKNLKEKMIDNSIIIKPIEDQTNWVLGISGGSVYLIFSSFYNFTIKLSGDKSFIPHNMLLLLAVAALVVSTIIFGFIKNILIYVRYKQDAISRALKSYDSREIKEHAIRQMHYNGDKILTDPVNLTNVIDGYSTAVDEVPEPITGIQKQIDNTKTHLEEVNKFNNEIKAFNKRVNEDIEDVENFIKFIEQSDHLRFIGLPIMYFGLFIYFIYVIVFIFEYNGL